MNVQQIRRDLAELVAGIATGWSVTTATEPDILPRLIVLGHADSITPFTFAYFRARFTLTLWASEDDTTTEVDDLYELLTPTSPKFLQTAMTAAGAFELTDWFIGNVGRRDEGPSGFLAGDVQFTVTCH